ncbi:MAG: hypothetical protein PHV09_07570, partial [Bacteroidales bacterium]|nr:hypothetical protein [Bacteroidales bacterium]
MKEIYLAFLLIITPCLCFGQLDSNRIITDTSIVIGITNSSAVIGKSINYTYRNLEDMEYIGAGKKLYICGVLSLKENYNFYEVVYNKNIYY